MATNRTNQNTRARAKERMPLYGILALLCVVFTALLTMLIVGVYFLVFMISYVDVEPKVNLEEYKENQDQTTIIYAYDSNDAVVELARLHGEQNRVWVTYREIPMKV